MLKNFVVHAEHCANKNDAIRTSQIIAFDGGAALGADERQTQFFPTKMDGDTDLLGL